MSAAPVLTIDLVSDLVSPWCYLAQRRLARALASVDGVCVPRLRWQPFEINPAMAQKGMAVDDYLETVFGSGRKAEDGAPAPPQTYAQDHRDRYDGAGKYDRRLGGFQWPQT